MSPGQSKEGLCLTVILEKVDQSKFLRRVDPATYNQFTVLLVNCPLLREL